MIQSTSLFNQHLNSYFNSISGAYTQMTAAEVSRVTFNVKAVLRDLLENNGVLIPQQYDSHNTITFNIFNFDSPNIVTQQNIVCKFCKPNKREVSIYFNTSQFPPNYLLESNYWFIFFKQNDPTPWLGFASKDYWENLLLNSTTIQNYISEINDTSNTFLPQEVTLTLVQRPLLSPKSNSLSHKSKKPHITKNVNRIQTAKKNETIGMKGEELILIKEKEKLISLGRLDLAQKVEWSSKNVGDGLGYDIKSFEIIDNKIIPIYIEVKSTEYDKNTPFFLSANELNFSINNAYNYRLYRIYNLNRQNTQYFILKGDLSQYVNLSPYTYQASF